MLRSEEEGAWFGKGLTQATCRTSASYSEHIPMLVLPLFCMLQPFPWFGLDVRHQGATDGEVNQFPIAHPSSSHHTSLQFSSHIPPSPITRFHSFFWPSVFLCAYLYWAFSGLMPKKIYGKRIKKPLPLNLDLI